MRVSFALPALIIAGMLTGTAGATDIKLGAAEALTGPAAKYGWRCTGGL